jgi:hypothetical protein
MKVEHCGQRFEKYSYSKFRKNPCSGGGGPSCSMRTDRHTDGRTDGKANIKNLIVAFRKFANVSKNEADNCTTERLRNCLPLWNSKFVTCSHGLATRSCPDAV